MCTVTIVPLIEFESSSGDRPREVTGARPGFRLACNRDELRTRSPGQPAKLFPVGTRRAIFPVDPDSNGTWVAVNDAGVAMTVLNVNRLPAGSSVLRREVVPEGGLSTTGSKRSRGEIIPMMLESASADAAGESCSKINPENYSPFRLILVDERAVWDVLSVNGKLTAKRLSSVRRPVLFTSSGLGDHLVEPPRRMLFEEMFTEPTEWVARQDAFHRHSWPARTRVSVCMSRDDARTVSHTVVEVLPHRVRMIYYPDAPDQCSEPTVTNLDRAAQPS